MGRGLLAEDRRRATTRAAPLPPPSRPLPGGDYCCGNSYGRVMISMPCPAGSMKYTPRPPW
ncbi:hypothetical protein QFZ56_001092 [Streptomyces achromogenes]|uniref:Uncharacterized protein n=1 Tax=Streptomyces achromogenes TaxID=67255 RepID=A0ABU0PUQ5_STRAH|nr:hypothetical protein [Streptomyces achromogenes]